MDNENQTPDLLLSGRSGVRVTSRTLARTRKLLDRLDETASVFIVGRIDPVECVSEFLNREMSTHEI